MVILSILIFSCSPDSKPEEDSKESEQATMPPLSVKTVARGIELTIDAPVEGEEIDTDIYKKMKGSFAGELPEGFEFWILIKDEFNYFAQYPKPTAASNKWQQKNIRLNTPGSWEIHICIANEEAVKWLDNKEKEGKFDGFEKLPKGIETVDFINVIRK